MSSITRSIVRRQRRKNGLPYVRNPQPTILLKSGGYKTLHPTKGWMTVSGKRVLARLKP